ncbi:MAG TPA: universal stress protein [Solirubrobacter sp.]|nr:universal stress protein [Solirubrobacter sp.]
MVDLPLHATLDELVELPAPFAGELDETAAIARRLLDAGTAVLLTPSAARPWRGRMGVGHDGGRGGDAALEAADRIARHARGQLARVDIAYVDDSASCAHDSDGDLVASRRAAAIEWWLNELSEALPAPVRSLRPVGDPAGELAELSEELDLLLIGTRGRARLRRALTGSVSRRLIGTCCCALLIVPPSAAAGRAAFAVSEPEPAPARA